MRLLGSSYKKADLLEQLKEDQPVLLSWQDEGKCVVCRACELACSFHHTGQYNPACSSIRIQLDRNNGTLQISLLATCDLCEGVKDGPMCIQACAHGALEFDIISAVKTG
ncbi:MAG: hypothetical protein JXA42_06410 [Anaerolineales bacterium]|nr:hypothetical protein [Anaerolineales bacterium]